MLVTVIGFGSNWWARFGRDRDDPYRFTKRAAYFNSTGVSCGRKIQHYWVIPGLLRFNGIGDFTPDRPNRCLGKTFECADLTFAFGGNRLLFVRKIQDAAEPDYYLVAISSNQHGYFDSKVNAWKSETVIAVAVSQFHEKCEALLLMKPGDWVRTMLGHWQVTRSGMRNAAALDLLAE